MVTFSNNLFQQVVANYFGATGTLDFFGEIKWPLDMGPPEDTPFCGYENENPACQPKGKSHILIAHY